MKKVILACLWVLLSSISFAQVSDSTQSPAVFSGVITATNNGISLLPNFSLNKPALLFDLSVAKGRLSFDPMFRFGANGKPWAFVFWWRYKLITQPQFNLSIGAHPSVVFRSLTSNGTEQLVAQRYVAWEAAPTWVLGKNVSAGLYYLGSHGLTKDLTQVTTFLTLRSTISNIGLSKQLRLTLAPQFYYLQMDQRHGTYVNASIFLSKKNFPVALSSIISQAIDTDIPGKTFVWNLGLNFNFNEKYVKK